MAAETKIKGKAKKTVDCCIPESKFAPRLYLNLQDKDVSQIKGLTVGDKVQVLVSGTVKGLEQRERRSYDDPEKVEKTGEIQLEGYKVEVLADEDNEFEDLVDDDA